MRSRASIKGHPIHPALIPFPIAFLTGGFFADLGGMILNKEGLWQAGFYLEIAGIVMALIAAVPGIIDYFYTVPPNSSGKKRATKHGLTNLSAVVLFIISTTTKGNGETAPTLWLIILEGIGTVLLCFGGYMGGTLVYRNQIGVDPRYADAGKWKEEKVTFDSGKRIEVAQINELKTNQMKLIHLDGKRIVIGKTEAGYVAFDDRCSHRGGSLAGGAMICGTVQCPWHGSQFDVKTGVIKAGPASQSITTYKIEQSGEKVFLIL